MPAEMTAENLASGRGPTRLMHGSLWMIAMRFSIRGIGLISTIILARILTPADFGIVAMAMLLIGFIEVFNDTGQQAALIANPNPSRAHYDTAWTISVIIAVVLTGIIFLAAPLASAYFKDPRITPVIELLSLRVLLGGFINIGTVDFRRNLDFSRELRFGLVRKLATFAATLTLALIWKNYWALAIGMVVGYMLEVGLSYAMHRYRPRFSFSKMREIWACSSWLLIQSIGRFFETRVDEVAVAGVAPPSGMGHYIIAAELGALPVTELVKPVSRALFPNYARIAADPERLRDVYLLVFSAAFTVSVCLGTGIALVAADLVALVLGPQWADSAPLMVWFATAAAVTGTCNTVYAVFSAAGQSRFSAIQTWLRVLAYLPAMAWAASTAVLVNFAIARFAVAIFMAPTYFFRLKRVIPITMLQLATVMWRPLLAAAAMAGALLAADLPAHIDTLVLRLPAEVFVGGVVFIAVQMGLWRVAGRPAGIECAALGYCGLTRLLSRSQR
jgi:lipopolysaccharide exporter